MRRTIAMISAGLLAACGGSSSNDGGTVTTQGTPTPNPTTSPTPNPTTSPTPNPTGTPGTSSVAVTGALAFAPQSYTGLLAQNTSCASGTTTTSSSFAGVVATSYAVAAGACSVAAQDKANATTLLVGVARSRTGAQPVGAVTTGTYRIEDNPSAAEDAPKAFVFVIKSDATCQVDPLNAVAGIATSGTVTLTSLAGTISGTVSATLAGGGTVTGTFAAPICAQVTGAQVCQATGTGTGAPTTCVQ